MIKDTASTEHAGRADVRARARPRITACARGGLQAEAAPLIVYTSAHSHSSVEKAALLAGFGRSTCAIVPHDDAHSPCAPEALDAMIQDDLAAGHRPCAVVATTGTTTSTALDPLAAIARMAKAHGLWLHVDAAMAGSAMILPECRWMWDGVEQADSLIVNAHKWLGAVFDCTLYFVRDPEHLVRVMSTSPSYLQTAADGQVKNYRDWGLPLGRRFRALKLWFLIREQGVEGLQARLRRDLDERGVARAADRRDTRMARARAGAAANAVRASRARRRDRRRRSIATRWPGPRGSTSPAGRMSRRRCSTAAGWCASRSAPS